MAGKQRGMGLIRFSADHPKFITWIMVVVTVALLAVAALPHVWPRASEFLNPVAIDTDPENMLSADEPVRVFHNAMKREFSLYDMVVVGVVNETHPDGVFNPQSLRRIYELSQYARALQWPDPQAPDQRIGVVEADMLAPSMVDNVEQAGLGAVSFDWLMPEPPATREEALAVRDRALRLPLLDGTPARDKDRHVLTGRLTWLTDGQTVEWSLFGFYSPSDQDAHLRPHLTYKVTDQWTVEAGANLFFGRDKHTFFGQFRNNSNVYFGSRNGF